MSKVVLEELLVQMSVRDKEVAEAFDSLNKKIDKFEGKTDKANKSVVSGFKNVKSAVLGVASAFATLTALNVVAEVAIKFEKLEASLRTIEGGAEGAGQAFAKIQDFAKTTPFQLEEVTGAYIKLKALGLDPSEAALNSFGNTATAMGKSLNQMIEAVADASTGEFERLKEFGIKARSEGENVTFTFQGIRTTVKKNSEDIQEYLRSIGEVQFAGAMAEQADTLNVAVSNMSDSWDRFFKAVGDAGVTDMLKTVSELWGDVANNLTRIVELDIAEGSLAHKMGMLTKEERENFEKQALVLKENEEAIASFQKQMQALNETGETGNNFVDLEADFNARETPDGLEDKLLKLQESLLSEQEILQADYEAKMLLAEEAFANSLIQEQEHNEIKKALKHELEESLTEIEDKERKKRERLESRHSNAVVSMKKSVVNEAVSLLNILGSKSKGAAILALTVQKGLAIAETIVNTQVAAMRALAELGPIAGPPVAASIEALGATKVGLIAATGLAQASTMGSGGGSVGGSVSGSSGSPVSSVDQATGSVNEPSSTQNITINLQGESFYSAENVRKLIESINDEAVNGVTIKASVS